MANGTNDPTFLEGITGLVDKSANKSEYDPFWISQPLFGRTQALGKLIRARDITPAINRYTDLINAGTGAAQGDVDYITGRLKTIADDNSTPLSYLNPYLDSIGGFIRAGRDDVANSVRQGLSLNNLRAGLGGVAPSGYDTVALSSALGGAFAPAYTAGVSGAGPFANNAYGQVQNWRGNLANWLQTNPFTRLRNSIAERELMPLNMLYNTVGAAGNTIGDLIKNAMLPNLLGVQEIPGLAERMGNMERGFFNTTNSAINSFGSLAGIMGGMGGMGGLGGMMGGMGGATQPNGPTFSSSGYPNSVGYGIPQQYTGNVGMSYGLPVQQPYNYGSISTIPGSSLPATGNYYTGMWN